MEPGSARVPTFVQSSNPPLGRASDNVLPSPGEAGRTEEGLIITLIVVFIKNAVSIQGILWIGFAAISRGFTKEMIGVAYPLVHPRRGSAR